MASLTTTSSNHGLNEELLAQLEMNIKVTDNPFNFRLSDLFMIGARKNPKRNFLFVSKLIGKHIPVNPYVPLLTGRLLATLYGERLGQPATIYKHLLAQSLKGEKDVEAIYESVKIRRVNLPAPTLILGFAETATGLGHAVFEGFGKNAQYIHTTREDLVDLTSSFQFEEEHSHATSHRCYGMSPDYFEQFDRIVLVDDEVTTGNTALNLITALNAAYPGKEYAVLSLLDWRQEEDRKRVELAEQELGTTIDFVSFIQGDVTYTNKPFNPAPPEPAVRTSTPIETYQHTLPVKASYGFLARTAGYDKTLKAYHAHTGRFGLNHGSQRELDELLNEYAGILSNERQSHKSLLLGTSELMHLPCAIASRMGNGIVTHSTTRSPIHIQGGDYPVTDAFTYTDHHHPEVSFFVYNVEPNRFKEVFFVTEQPLSDEEREHLTKSFAQRGVQHLHFVSFDYPENINTFANLKKAALDAHDGFATDKQEMVQQQIQKAHKEEVLNSQQCNYLFGLLHYGRE